MSTNDLHADRYGDPEHWKHVMEQLHVPAIEEAGYEPVLPVANGSQLIISKIIEHLSKCEMVLCDLSGLNPNVLFELGVRTSLNLPIALVKDKFLKLPFDTSGVNTEPYVHELRPWDIEAQRAKLAKHIKDAAITCDGKNPMWQAYGLQLKATEPTTDESPLAAKVDLLAASMSRLEESLGRQALTDEVLTRALDASGNPFSSVNPFSVGNPYSSGNPYVSKSALLTKLLSELSPTAGGQGLAKARLREQILSLLDSDYPRLAFEIGELPRSDGKTCILIRFAEEPPQELVDVIEAAGRMDGVPILISTPSDSQPDEPTA